MGARLLSRPPPQADYQGRCFIHITNKVTLNGCAKEISKKSRIERIKNEHIKEK
jgi:hypothetical protein